MNERIQELIKQAENYAAEQNDKFGVSYKKEYNQKFAELIIAKCIEEAGDPADGLIKGNTWHDGVRASIWSIRQYFGVK